MPRPKSRPVDSARPKQVTLQDIANVAGLNVMTVSNALRNSRIVAPATRERVKRIAHELNYVPNSAAKALSTGRTSLIAIMTGPIVLTRDVRLGGPDVDDVLTPLTDTAGYFPLEPVNGRNKEIWIEYKGAFLVESDNAGQENKEMIPLCDYASAGKTYDDKSRFRVWLEQNFNPAK